MKENMICEEESNLDEDLTGEKHSNCERKSRCDQNRSLKETKFD